MKIRKTAAFAASALIALNLVSILTNAEEMAEYSLISAPMSRISGVKSLEIMGGGYYLCHDEEGTAFRIIYIGNEELSEWRKTGEFTWKDVECDLELENFCWFCSQAGNEGDFCGIALKDDEFTKYYYCEINDDRTRITAERMYFDWACVRPDGYACAIAGDSSYFGKGAELNKINMGYDPDCGEFRQFILTSGEYTGGTFYWTSWDKESFYDDKRFRYATLRLADKNGNVTEVYSTPEPGEDNYCSYVSQSSIAYNNSVLHWRENYVKDGVETKLQRIYCFQSGELLTFPYNTKLCDGRTALYTELYDGVFNGRAIMKVKLNYVYDDTYALADTETGEFVSDTYESLTTCDGEYYLAKDEHGWTLIDRDGNSLCDFDDVTEFYGGFAMACENGEGFLINGNMEKISDTIPAESIYMCKNENIFVLSREDESYFVTYVKNDANTEIPATGNTSVLTLAVCMAASGFAVIKTGRTKINR